MGNNINNFLHLSPNNFGPKRISNRRIFESPYSVHAKRITMTQEAIQRQIEAIDRVAATLNTPEKARQFLIDAGIIKAPKKKAKAKRQTK